MSAKQFEIELNAAFAEKMQDVHGFVRSLFLEALRGVVLRTPVDTGRLTGNWSMSFSQPSTDVYNTKTPDASIARVSKTVASYSKDKFPTAFLQNNLPYASRIEEGYSKVKAPQGMVAVTVASLTAKYKTVTF